ncbi:MAG TPA: hydantoinase/oxoprolinase family protein [Clostridia bacterium]|nr:hydantoinase/oxoprolinase family protein [Clostridia bacterium]
MIIGLDMGGTHVDGVIIEDGKVINTVKNPTNRENLFKSIWTTLKELVSGYDKSKIQRINLSTTISTNAIVENKTSPVGMIIQSGPGLPHNFLACGDQNVFISGYVDHRGELVEDLDSEEIKEAARLFKDKGIESCAVITKFCTRNFNHELEIKEILCGDFPSITMGHNISGKLNFPRRVFTSYLNAAVHSTFNSFSSNIKKSMEEEGIDAPLFILKADGGTTSLLGAKDQPVETILSGPAASLMGLKALMNTMEDAILLDVGGTTTDIFFLADGVPLFEPQGIEIGSYKTLVRAIYSFSIGLGGDSSIHVEKGKLKIGPNREGPPFALGGPKPTPTDAMIALELMDFGDNDRAMESMENLGSELNLSPKDVAEKILEIVGDMIKDKVDKLLFQINSKPVYTIKELLQGKRIQPKAINIIGGPAKLLQPILEEKFNLPCHFPQHYHVANALGAARAKITTDINLIADTSRGILSVPELGVAQKIGRNFDLHSARDKAIELLTQKAVSLGANANEIETEIIEESSFNMVDGFFTKGKNIRIRAQVKPGLIHEIGSVEDD